MKIAKFFAVVFGILGGLVMAGSIGLCLVSLNAPVRMEEVPDGAVRCAEEFAQAISQKEFGALEDCLYGQPELGMEGTLAEPMTAKAWELFENSLAFAWQGECYMDGAVLCRDGQVTYLEAASLTDDLPNRAHALLSRKVEEASDMAQLYDDSGEFREDLMDQVLAEALEQACAEDAKTVTAAVTVQFVFTDGRWWAVPDAALLSALSGGLA